MGYGLDNTKELSDQIKKDLNKQFNCNDKLENVQKRVYDTINVLIAMDIFRKEGK